jgi:MFS family permease
VSGLGGSYLAILMAAYTYITCLVEGEERMVRVGVAESAVFLSSTISVFVSGRLIDALGFMPVFGIALACQVSGNAP